MSACGFSKDIKNLPYLSDERIRQIAQDFTHQNKKEHAGELVITSPYNGAVFPPEIAAPQIAWLDSTPGAQYWVVSVELNTHRVIYNVTNETQWMPSEKTWEIIKKDSIGSPGHITVMGFKGVDTPVMISRSSILISTSKDRVDALILYRQVPLPFMVGEENFRKIRWRLGDIAAYGRPAVVMSDIPICASCHQVTGNGKKISMEMNFQNDSGAQFLTDVQENIELSKTDFMTWTAFPKPVILPKTRGLFARMSPSGKFIVATVNEISYAAITNDPAFSQLFFPTYGILASYSVDKKTFQPLNGADNAGYIQTNPSWSPDEKEIAFALSETKNHYHEDIAHIKTHFEDRGIEELNRKFPVQFDIWKIPFTKGEGGRAMPVKGASNNGMSNYFPRFSPDGKWIVYTRSKTGIMLQPDSELYIVPAGGGEERRMKCNTARFNSWHSWSPNSKWLLFSSKVNSMYTEIFLTHIDENGNDSPPVCLFRFSNDQMAANVPEFIDLKAGKIKKIWIQEHN
jgi:WD40-like Beta Propeller Repeat